MVLSIEVPKYLIKPSTTKKNIRLTTCRVSIPITYDCTLVFITSINLFSDRTIHLLKIYPCFNIQIYIQYTGCFSAQILRLVHQCIYIVSNSAPSNNSRLIPTYSTRTHANPKLFFIPITEDQNVLIFFAIWHI